MHKLHIILKGCLSIQRTRKKGKSESVLLSHFIGNNAVRQAAPPPSTGVSGVRFSNEPGPSCSKLTMSLVNDSLKFTSSDTQIC